MIEMNRWSDRVQNRQRDIDRVDTYAQYYS